MATKSAELESKLESKEVSSMGHSLIVLSGKGVKISQSEAFLSRENLRKFSLQETMLHLTHDSNLRQMLEKKVVVTSTDYLDAEQGLHSIDKNGDLASWREGENKETTAFYGFHGSGRVTVHINNGAALKGKYGRRYEIISSSRANSACDIDRSTSYQSVIIATKLSGGRTNPALSLRQ